MYLTSKNQRVIIYFNEETGKNDWENGYFKRLNLHQLAFSLKNTGVLISASFKRDKFGNPRMFSFCTFKLM
jgi:hypothetical protein